jgi:hypothetical protein
LKFISSIHILYSKDHQYKVDIYITRPYSTDIAISDSFERIQIMTTTTTKYPTHEGLERVLNTARAIKASAAKITAQRLRQAASIAALMAVVTFAERNLSLGESGFVFEWMGLSLVVLLAFFCTWMIALPLASVLTRWVKRVNTHFRDQANDRALYAAALKDARIMGDLRAAQGRSEAF